MNNIKEKVKNMIFFYVVDTNILYSRVYPDS